MTLRPDSLPRSRGEALRIIATRAREACVFYVGQRHRFDPSLDCSNNTTLTCFCGIASAYLVEVLHGLGLPAALEGDHNHAWVRSGHWIVDITASQFPGQPPIIVRRSRRKPQPITLDDWPPGQRATRKRLKKLHSLF